MNNRILITKYVYLKFYTIHIQGVTPELLAPYLKKYPENLPEAIKCAMDEAEANKST